MKVLPLVCAATLATSCAGRSTPPASSAPAPAPAPAAAPAAAPATLRYAAGTVRYRFDSRTHVEQEVMGSTNAADITTAALFTAALADAEGSLGVTVTIDSLGITAPMGLVGSTELDAARGKVVRLVLSRDGHPVSVTPPEGAGPSLTQMAQGLREFFPQLPPAGTDAGTTWTDTTTNSSPSQGINVTVTLMRQHRIAGWEDRNGARALHIATTATYTVTGSGEAQGQSIQLTGGGQAASDAFVSAAGVYLGGAASDSSLINANVTSAGMVVPIRRTTRSTFTRLP